MSEQATETSTAAEPPDGSTSERLGRVEAAVERIENALSRVLPGSHAEAQERTEERLDRPSSIEEQVRAELEKRDRQAAEQAAAEKEKADKETVAQRLARLEETPPAPPRLKRTALLGWGDGRG